MVVEQTLPHDDTDPARPDGRPAEGDVARELTARTFAAVVGGILVVQVAACLYLLRHSYFFAEDFAYLVILDDQPVDSELLRRSVFGHLVPGYLLVQKFWGSWIGADWALASLATLAVQLGGTVAFARLLLALVGRRTWWVAWLTAAFGLSTMVLNTAPWWAATWTMQITLVAAVSAWGCTLRYARSRHWRHLASLAVMYTVSVAFFEKSVVTSAYLGLFVLVVGAADEEGWGTRFRRALSLWPAWVVIAVVSAADMGVYLTGPYLDASGEPAGLGQQAEYLARSLPEGAFTTLIGAVYPVSTIPGPDLLTVVVATAACLGVVVWTSLRSRLARRAWGWYFLVTLLSQALVARGRLNLFDMDVVLHNLRYQGDAVYLYLIAVAVAVPAAVRTGADPTRRTVTVAAVVAPLLALPLWLQSVHALAENSPGHTSRDHFAELRSGDPGGPFLDLPVPGWVVPEGMYPWNMAHLVLPQVRSDVDVTDDPDGALWIRPDGSIAPVQLVDVTTPTSEVVCLGPGDPAAAVLSTSAEQLAEVPPPVLLALDYRADGPGQLVIEVGRQGARKDVRADGTPFAVHDGAGRLASVIAPTRWRNAYVEVTEGSEVCVTAVRLVRPQG